MAITIDSQIIKIEKYLNKYKTASKRVFVSSSFQSHSIPLLHIISILDKTIPVYFLNTGYHFPETITFKNHVADLLGLNVHSLESNISKIYQKDSRGRFHFCANTDYCCHINKVLPLEPILIANDIWITGVRREQNTNRSNMTIEANGPHNITRFHPMLDWSSKMIWDYRKSHELPDHPLEKKGYLSVGCAPCTQKYPMGERTGRWAGLQKTECGLHTELIDN